MSAKTRRIAYMATAGGVLLALMGGVTIAANMQSNNLDLLLGRGEKHVKDNGQLEANYINFTYDNQDDALANAQAMTQLTAEEGMTLLKNDKMDDDKKALPLAADEGVTVLGYYSWHNNMSGGEDPATTNGAVSLANGIENLFQDKFNAKTKELYANAGGDFADPATALASAESTFAQFPTAVITLKRNSGEGNDQSMNVGSGEQNRSNLVITNAELKLIDYASKHFNKVIIVVNAANAMELGWLQDSSRDENMDANGIYTDPYNKSQKYDFSKVKAAIWAGCCGSQGGTALARILKGEVNPSGHLVDTYVRDLTKDPTYVNFGSFVYENSDELNSYQDETFFVDYEEGIYVGYRYYETAAAEAAKGNYAGFDYDKAVVFPFGYGLSYTTFSREFVGTPTFNQETNEFTFTVKMTNTGSFAGKGVSQLYVNVPYLAGGIEKSHVTMVGFNKTQILQPGESETFDIVVNQDYFTSYDYQGEKAYILDAGDYNFYLSDNAHSWAEIDKMEVSEKSKLLWTYNVDKKLVFTEKKDGKRPTDKTEAVNKEDDELNYHFKDFGGEYDHGEGYAINFTRSNFSASFPQAPRDDDLYVEDARALKAIAKYDVWAEENNPITQMPTVDTDGTSYTLASMRGVDFDDPKWDDYMNQFTLDSMATMVTNGGWNEKADVENGVPESYDADSPYGYYAAALSIKNINKWYCGDPMVAATFNVELARKVGDAFGEEAHANYLAGGSLITGLYGYGLNMHRSAFGGRNYEYYAEDGILAGKMASAEASGASEKGLIVFMKHYCLNDQETNRQKNGYCAWVNEQAFREVYLKGWELYMKESKMTVNYYEAQADGSLVMASKTMSAATGIMTSYNRIGATWGGASVSIQGILQQEFGFTGTALTDAGGEKNTYMTSDFMIRRGGHLTLCNNGSDGLYDTDSPTAVYYIKDAAKHILFNKANSNCVQNLSPSAVIWYDMSPWKVGLIVAWVGIGAITVADGIYIGLVASGKVGVKELAESAEEY